ncbi:MAG TPA: nicotinamide-nucleotide amidohydrolase family protein [Candidatus Ornithospirochaeta avicola]|uniref:CinA-like protein n=1 Tax=Candidatus Ornithospirochaeta avicola TaxID=2840896 RepID=A0A9D1PS04_9SPIO|nr:nicotinamide-nucleotide amidohydrolase family protein [Candidatus Ornithospirochaeta avicola]
MINASLIIIGSELTRGVIEDKHGKLVAKELTGIGINVVELVTIPDDGSISYVLSALKRYSDVIIVTGGLGPTQDDLTRKAISDSFSSPLYLDETVFAKLKDKLKEKAEGANKSQAYFPRGARIIANENGTADGFALTKDGKSIYALPGPPKEMRPMFYSYVLEDLKNMAGLGGIKRAEFSSLITAEARLEELFEKASRSVSFATRFQDYKISVYLSGSDSDVKDAISYLRKETGEYRILDGDTDAKKELVNTLIERNLTISTAESLTGGLLGTLLTEDAGSSRYYVGSLVSYATRLKEDLLRVPSSCIEKHGVVSKETALFMAENVRSMMKSDVAVSLTGVAGPDEQDGRKVGTVCIGFSIRGRESEAVELDFSSWGRSSVRKKALVSAFILANSYIKGEDVVKIASGWRNI